MAKLRGAMADLKLTFPCIMKPRVACGTPESHAMALLLNLEGLGESRVALPASFQVRRRMVKRTCLALLFIFSLLWV
jgi:hypothetical protein